MRRIPVLAATAALALTTATAAGASTATDTVITTASVGGLTIAGGVLPTAAISTPIGSTSSIAGSLMTVSDLRGGTNGWDVTAKYVAPAASTSIAGVVTPITALGASAVKVKTSGTATTTLGGSLSYQSSDFVALDATTGVNVANAATGTSGGVTTFTPSYQVSIPSNATVGTLYGAGVEYTLAPKS